VVVERCSIIDNGIETFLPRKMIYLANFLKENSGKFVSREYILENLWHNVCVDERTIDVHIRRLREVFPNIPIKTQVGVGYGWITDN
jgi:two-component system alkaline phosphatase synthesis response regulator PhoP